MLARRAARKRLLAHHTRESRGSTQSLSLARAPVLQAGGSTLLATLGHQPGITLQEIHMSRPSWSDIPSGRKILMCVRDPIDRVVSAFNYRHPQR